MGRYDEAIIAYSQVLHLDPSDGSAAEQRGEALMNAGKYQEAIASYDRAIAMNPGRSEVLLNRSIAKQLASGVVKANLSAAYRNETAVLNSSIDLTVVTLSGSTLPATIPMVSPVPGTTKAAASIPVMLAALVIAGFMSLIFRRR